MRLLHIGDDGGYSLTKFYLASREIPQYAILSHTWGDDGDEVSLEDLRRHEEVGKPGVSKLKFCTQQAMRDGLRYVWIDSCCIDQKNLVELTEAINSMFRYYQRAVKCYVFLSDVSGSTQNRENGPNQTSWMEEFRKSRWFRRGWTLQELLAPATVEFFTQEGHGLGSKVSLERVISEMTGIPVTALRGKALADFSVDERMAWREGRETKREEDLAYSMLGIYDVSLPILYGEGETSAFRRLRKEINERTKGKIWDQSYEILFVSLLPSQINVGSGDRQYDFSVAFSISAVSDVRYFVGREQELSEIHKELHGDGSRRVIVLHGLGGVGKSQLVLSYVKRFKDQYSAIFWLNARTQDCLAQSFAEAARRILRAQPSAKEVHNFGAGSTEQETIEAVKDWLSLPQNTRWLLVLDGYDGSLFGHETTQPYELRELLPDSHQGAILVTTRSSHFDVGRRMKIRKFEDIADSKALLESSSQRATITSDANMMMLLNRLDGLPIALASAGAYLELSSLSCRDYVHLYDTSWEQLLRSSPMLQSYDGENLPETWQSSLHRINVRNPSAIDFLKLWAYLDGENVWYELIAGRNVNASWSRSEIDFYNVMRTLCDEGLVEPNYTLSSAARSTGYRIHPCVHMWVRMMLARPHDGTLAIVARHCIITHTQSCFIREEWLVMPLLIKHGRKVWANALTDGNASKDHSDQPDERPTGFSPLDLVTLARLFDQQGRWSEAEPIWKRAVDTVQTQTLDGWVLKASMIFSAGENLRRQWKLDKAKALLLDALPDITTALGSSHNTTLQIFMKLGAIALDEWDTCNAIQHLQEVLNKCACKERADDLMIAKAHSYLGLAMARAENEVVAEEFCHSAYKLCLQLHGAEHVETLLIEERLVGVILLQKNAMLSSVEQRVLQLISGFSRVLGPNHRNTLYCRALLGRVNMQQENFEEADRILELAKEKQVESFGASDFDTISTVYTLGMNARIQKQWQRAEKYLSSAVAGFSHIIGRDKFLTAGALYHLGLIYERRKDFEAAAALLRHALGIYKSIEGVPLLQSAPCSIASQRVEKRCDAGRAKDERANILDQVFTGKYISAVPVRETVSAESGNQKHQSVASPSQRHVASVSMPPSQSLASPKPLARHRLKALFLRSRKTASE